MVTENTHKSVHEAATKKAVASGRPMLLAINSLSLGGSFMVQKKAISSPYPHLERVKDQKSWWGRELQIFLINLFIFSN